MPMRASNWAELLLPTIYSFYDVGRTMRPEMRPEIYNVQTSSRNDERNVGYGGISPDSWDNYENSGVKSRVDFDKGYVTTYTHREYVVTMEIERKLMDDDQYGIVAGERARKLGISATQKMELDAASVFNNAFNTSYQGGDGKPLCSVSHPRNPNKTGNLSNSGTSTLTKDAVSLTRQAMMATEDDAGNILGMMPNAIMVPPELEDTALEIVNSMQDPSSANNTINPQAGRFQVVAWHYLTDSNNWFMMDTVWMRENLKWYNRQNLEISVLDQTATEAVYEAYMRYSFGWDDWRWVYGHNVT